MPFLLSLPIALWSTPATVLGQEEITTEADSVFYVGLVHVQFTPASPTYEVRLHIDDRTVATRTATSAGTGPWVIMAGYVDPGPTLPGEYAVLEAIGQPAVPGATAALVVLQSFGLPRVPGLPF